MTTKKLIGAGVLALAMMTVMSGTASAQRFGGHGRHHGSSFGISIGSYGGYGGYSGYGGYGGSYCAPVYRPCYPVYRPVYRSHRRHCW